MQIFEVQLKGLLTFVFKWYNIGQCLNSDHREATGSIVQNCACLPNAVFLCDIR